jgi:hypothetical protein
MSVQNDGNPGAPWFKIMRPSDEEKFNYKSISIQVRSWNSFKPY